MVVQALAAIFRDKWFTRIVTLSTGKEAESFLAASLKEACELVIALLSTADISATQAATKAIEEVKDTENADGAVELGEGAASLLRAT